MDVRTGPLRKLRVKELLLLNYTKKTIEGTLDCREIQPVHPKGNQSWIFIGRTDAEAETPIVWPPDAKSWLIREDPDAGKNWRQEEKGMTKWDGWMVSPTCWTWVWASSRSWWWTGKPGVFQSMGSQRVGYSWATELNWTETKFGGSRHSSLLQSYTQLIFVIETNGFFPFGWQFQIRSFWI